MEEAYYMELSGCEIPVITGPTAIGKTELGIILAEKIGGEIISMDSRQIFRRMNIGTAKVSAAEVLRVRHHLIDIADPGDRYTVDDFVNECGKAIEDIVSRGKRPIIVGGTPFYLFSLMGGLDFCKVDSDDAMRARLTKEAEESGNEAFHSRLAEVDSQSASEIHPNDIYRVARALEIYYLSGTPASELRSADRPDAGNCSFLGHSINVYILYTEREKIYDLINRRTELMFHCGLLEETEAILQWKPGCRDFLLKTIGYAQAIGVMEGTMTVETAVEQAAKFTRHFAKRQLTWFRSMTGAKWIEKKGDSLENLADNIAGTG